MENLIETTRKSISSIFRDTYGVNLTGLYQLSERQRLYPGTNKLFTYYAARDSAIIHPDISCSVNESGNFEVPASIVRIKSSIESILKTINKIPKITYLNHESYVNERLRAGALAPKATPVKKSIKTIRNK